MAGEKKIAVALDLLLTQELTPAAKLIWIALWHGAGAFSPAKLARFMGLARSTAYEALDQLAASRWALAVRDRRSGKRRLQAVRPASVAKVDVWFPTELIKAREVRPRVRLIFGLLQATHNYADRRGQFKWAQLCELVGMNVKTVRRAVRALALAGWVVIHQDNRNAPVCFMLQNALQALQTVEWAKTRRGLDRAPHCGEAAMREYLTLRVDSDDYVDNATLHFLINPETNSPLEFDRYYPKHKVAFEFNGDQHYTATERYRPQEVDAQRKRDDIKRAMCKALGIKLVVVRPEDLSEKRILAKVGTSLPLRDRKGSGRLIRYLESVSRGYRKAVEKARAAQAKGRRAQ